MFDERQLTARRRGYTGGFWGLLAMLGANLAISHWLGHPLFADQVTMTVTTLFLIMTPLTSYFILTGAYLRPHQRDTSLLGLALLGGAWVLMTAQDLWWKITLHYGAPLVVRGQLTRDAVTVVLLPLVAITVGAVSGYQWWRNHHPQAD